MLEGRLVRLRANEPADAARARAWLSDPAVTRYLPERYAPSSQDAVWPGPGLANSFERGVRLAIETKEGVHIGGVMLDRIRPEDRKAALGIIVGDDGYWSDGHGADAIATMLTFAFHDMNLHRVWLQVIDGHDAAIGCYRACGFREEARLRQEVYRHGAYVDLIVMSVLRDEFDAAHAGRNGSNEGSE